jgi:hypothetical protein
MYFRWKMIMIVFFYTCKTIRDGISFLFFWRTGGIFREDQKDGSAELAFKYAVYRLNRERTILPNTTLVYDIQYVPRDDSFRTSKKGNNINNNHGHSLPPATNNNKWWT